ncbi:universal stress protein [Antarcticibacterium flavum]|uniref:Universal stress protein n=1 Tax=Antarcticibacterium flavum TaxID=2058175 RepID=A0A5B7X8F7_9FLAO|nr:MULTISPECIES: universal stress protein [Antarcticibacterium]MCM4159259.1 hypothetical protein [Antarcticibacterium sp. W02-3]QCY71028.1 universal stress protein [Antarcticibacterium flavum]
MNKRNRIIILVDFSEYSENLIEFGFSLSKKLNGKLVFVHQVAGVVPALADEGSRNEILKAEISDAHIHLRDLLKERIQDENAIHISPKPILSILKELSNELYFDWVLTGLKTTGVLKRLFIGSTPLSIIDESNHLTLAVPIKTPVAIPQKLLVGVTPKFPMNREQFQVVLTSLTGHIKQIEFFTVLKDDEDEDKAKVYLQKLQKEFDTLKSEFSIYKGDNALDLLKKQVHLTMDSFLVLQQGSRTLNDKLFRKFMINEVVYGAQTPLIVLSS